MTMTQTRPARRWLARFTGTGARAAAVKYAERYGGHVVPAVDVGAWEVWSRA